MAASAAAGYARPVRMCGPSNGSRISNAPPSPTYSDLLAG